MNSKDKSFLTIVARLLFLLLLVTPVTLLAEPSGKVLAVQLSEEAGDPEQPQFIDELSNYAGAPLRYVKPRSDGQHLFQVVKPLPNKQLNKLVSRLEKNQFVEQVTILR